MQFLDSLTKLFPKTPKREYFLCLVLRDRKVQAIVFESEQALVRVLGTSSVDLSSPIDKVEGEELLEACDRAIAEAEESLPAQIFASKTILGLKDEWIEGGEIKKEYLAVLKRLRDELELTFIGFLGTTEAVCHLLQKQEGVPPTALVVGKDGKVLTVAFVRAGRVATLRSFNVEEEKHAESLERILKTFKDYEILPSRIILFDSQHDLEVLRQEFVSFPWTKSLPFLHFPKIETVKEDFVLHALISGFATEMGVAFEAERPPADEKEKVAGEKEERFGFIQGKDIVEEKIFPSQRRFKDEETEGTFDVASTLKAFIRHVPHITLKLRRSLPSLAVSLTRRVRFYLFLPILFLLLLSVSYLLVPKATITLFVKTKMFETEREVTIDPTIGTTDLSSKKIKGNTIAVEEIETMEILATGKKEVGEKSRGEVTLYNSSTQTQTFQGGTMITASNGLKFALDSKVTVASASGDVFTGTIPSKEKGAVIASQIGEESNLPSGTTFTIGSLTTVAAKNEHAFSGGTKKEVDVVSRADQEKLLKQVLDRLSAKAKERVGSEASGQRIIDASLASEILERKYSRTVDEEAKNVSLTLKVRFRSVSFDENDLKKLFEEDVHASIPKDFTLKKDGMTVSLAETRVKKDKSILAKAKVSATLLPKIDERQIRKKVRGKSLQEAFNLLGQTSHVSDYKIKVSPVFPLLPKLLPIREGNIRVAIVEHG